MAIVGDVEPVFSIYLSRNAAISQSEIMYKDLKASHVFVDNNLRVSLIDFGMCEVVSDGTTSVPAGTFHSMSPEMLDLYLKKL